MNPQIIFYNGKWYPAAARPAFLDIDFFVYQHVLHYASSVFEGTRCYPNLAKKNGTLNLVGVDLRIDRLFKSMEYAWMKLPPNPSKVWDDFTSTYPNLVDKYKTVLKGKIKKDLIVQFPYTPSRVKEFIIKTILLNMHSGFVDAQKGCYVRPVAMRGTTPDKHLGVFSLGHSVDFLVSVKPWGKYLGKEAFEKGAPIVVAPESNSEYNRQHKLAANYLTGQRLVNFASFNHFNEVLMTDETPQHNVLEGSGENLIFCLGNNRYVSPNQDKKPILPGTTLKVIDQIIRLLGGEIEYRDIPLEEVLSGKFKGAAMTGTAVEITPISLVYDSQTKKVVEIPVVDEIKNLQKVYLDLVQGSPVDSRLASLQKNLLTEVHWNDVEHAALMNCVEPV